MRRLLPLTLATAVAVLASFAAAAVVQAYTNPVYSSSKFPDPMVLQDGGTYWAYGTGPRYPMLKSTDLVSWSSAGHALRSKPKWAVPDLEWHPWAPSVTRREAKCPGAKKNGPCFLMFFSALSDDFGKRTNCMAVATSSTPAGPFSDQGILRNEQGTKIGCGDSNGYGNIDPHPFVDTDGKAYLYVSTDFDCSPGCTLRPTISVIPLTADLMRASAPRKRLFPAIPETWEQAPWAPVVENPWVLRRNGKVHMLFSGGGWTKAYGMGHAVADSPTGEFKRTSDDPTTTDTIETLPFLAQTNTVFGPGGGSLVKGPNGGEWLVYHAKSYDTEEDVRKLYIDPLTWDDKDLPVVAGPTSTPVANNP